ncbi:hypothetical protein [Nocardia cyriacigeorgica]|uniref:hypothetical protein n=1 Tax=Nocardia cyriacigeorgica TaxID=135487 RepID=UPI0024572AFB|nr:hypothetical protein [Nocardia cyriacigeorgica]
MAFAANVLKVMISSPGDTAAEVEAVKNALHGWNGSRAESAQVVLLPRFWKTDAVPRLSSEGGQGVINSQLVDSADIVIALFDARLGQATDTAVSGTAEEIERASAAGKHVHVWFSDEPLDRHADPQELIRLNQFRSELEGKGLFGVYADLNDLAYKVRYAVEDDINEMGLGAPSVIRKGDHALPRMQVERETDSRGREMALLVLENKSQSVTARQLKVNVGPWKSAIYRDDDAPFDLPPLQKVRWPMQFSMNHPLQTTVEVVWSEDDGEHTVSLPVTSR